MMIAADKSLRRQSTAFFGISFSQFISILSNSKQIIIHNQALKKYAH